MPPANDVEAEVSESEVSGKDYLSPREILFPICVISLCIVGEAIYHTVYGGKDIPFKAWVAGIILTAASLIGCMVVVIGQMRKSNSNLVSVNTQLRQATEALKAFIKSELQMELQNSIKTTFEASNQNLVESTDALRSMIATLIDSNQKLVESNEEVLRRVGIKVDYIEGDTDEKVNNVFVECVKVINRATESIIVVNSFSAGSASHQSGEIDAYYDAMINKAKETAKSLKKIQYHRILQIHGPTMKDLAADPNYKKHFCAMLDEQKKRTGADIALKKVQGERQTTFVLVDGKYLIWQINHLKDDKPKMHGVFIIDDPRRQITQSFIDFYHDLDNKADKVERTDFDCDDKTPNDSDKNKPEEQRTNPLGGSAPA